MKNSKKIFLAVVASAILAISLLQTSTAPKYCCGHQPDEVRVHENSRTGEIVIENGEVYVLVEVDGKMEKLHEVDILAKEGEINLASSNLLKDGDKIRFVSEVDPPRTVGGIPLTHWERI